MAEAAKTAETAETADPRNSVSDPGANDGDLNHKPEKTRKYVINNINIVNSY